MDPRLRGKDRSTGRDEMPAATNLKGLERVKEIYEHRDQRVKELKSQGKKILGYYCCYPVLEMMTALDLAPYRILGNPQAPITHADKCLPTIVCPFVRSSLDLGLKGEYSFLDGFVSCHSCDSFDYVHEIWPSYVNFPFYTYLWVPHNVHKPSLEFFLSCLKSFQNSLEQYAGKKISREGLAQAIHLHNEHRALMRDLYTLRKQEPPLVRGSELQEVIIAAMSLPVQEGSKLLSEIREDIVKRNSDIVPRPRVLLWGVEIDDSSFVKLIEEAGANVVMDDTCIGSRHYWSDVELTPDLLEGIAKRYLVDILCPRTFREHAGNYTADLEGRFRYLKDYCEEYKVDGVILQTMRYCDCHAYDAPLISDYLKEAGIPVLYLEHDYFLAATAPLRNRLQAFVEIIGGS